MSNAKKGSGSSWSHRLAQLAVAVLTIVLVILSHFRYKALPDHSAWMFDVEIITVMGYLAQGSQSPMQTSHKHNPMSAYAQNTALIAKRIRSGDVIVILRPTLETFLDLITPTTPSFTLVSVNYDDAITPQLRRQICGLKSIRKYYGQNVMNGVCNDRIFPLPLGLNQHKDSNPTGAEHPVQVDRQIMELRHRLANGSLTKKPRILITHTAVITGPTAYSPADPRPIRQAYAEDLAKLPFADVVDHIPLNKYLETLATYAFVLSPPGNGYDCFRTWEVLAVGSIPIVHDDGRFDQRVFDGVDVWTTQKTSEVAAQFETQVKQLKPVSVRLPEKLSLSAWHRTFTQSE
eukprot:m.57229 g.57229  ORF g.57229 m.57229 type:complete len:347 (+) comp22350_c0_seq1:495-1535(+)